MTGEVLWPLPDDLDWLDDERAATYRRVRNAALAEVGGRVEPGRMVVTDLAHAARAQQIAYDATGIPYRLVSHAEYQDGVLALHVARGSHPAGVVVAR